MMARDSTALAPYTPSLYLPGNYGRFRTYPQHVRTPIPGAGFRNVKHLVWGEQLLNIDGARGPFTYGRYPAVPLLGLAGDAMSLALDNPIVLGLALVGLAEFARRQSRRSSPTPTPNTRRARLRKHRRKSR